MFSKFAPNDHGPRFSTWRRSEDIVSRVTCVDQGGMWCVSFQSLFPNDREKETKHKKQKNKNIADGPCPCDARAAPKIAVP